MANFQFNIPQLLQQAFGIKGFTPNFQKSAVNIDFSVPTIDVSDEVKAYSSIGTPIYELLVFRHSSFDSDLVLMDVPLVTVSRTKNIIKSSVAGQNGTFKQVVSNGDYMISVRGILFNTESWNVKPFDKIQQINDLGNLLETVEVESEYLNLLGIDEVLVEDFRFEPMTGIPHVMPYSLELVSDKAFELQLLDL